MTRFCDLCDNNFSESTMISVNPFIYCKPCWHELYSTANRTISPIQIGGERATYRYFEKLVIDNEVSNEAFRMTYYVVYDLGWFVKPIYEFSEVFGWNMKITVEAVKELEKLKLIKINE